MRFTEPRSEALGCGIGEHRERLVDTPMVTTGSVRTCSTTAQTPSPSAARPVTIARAASVGHEGRVSRSSSIGSNATASPAARVGRSLSSTAWTGAWGRRGGRAERRKRS